MEDQVPPSISEYIVKFYANKKKKKGREAETQRNRNAEKKKKHNVEDFWDFFPGEFSINSQ